MKKILNIVIVGVLALSFIFASCSSKKEDMNTYQLIASEKNNQKAMRLIEEFLLNDKQIKTAFEKPLRFVDTMDLYEARFQRFVPNDPRPMVLVEIVFNKKIIAEFNRRADNMPIRQKAFLIDAIAHNHRIDSSIAGDLATEYAEAIFRTNTADSLPGFSIWHHTPRVLAYCPNSERKLLDSAHAYATSLYDKKYLPIIGRYKRLREATDHYGVPDYGYGTANLQEALKQKTVSLEDRMIASPYSYSFSELMALPYNRNLSPEYYACLVLKAKTYEDCQDLLRVIPDSHVAIQDACTKKAQNILGIGQCE